MNLREFQRDALRTESTIFHISSVSPRIIHGITGIVTEVGELQEGLFGSSYRDLNLKEEIGDIMWYMALLLDDLHLTFDSIPCKELITLEGKPLGINKQRELASWMNIYAGKLTNQLKRALFYGKPWEQDLIIDHLRNLYQYILTFCDEVNVNIGDVCEAVIAKLRKRYPDKFTVQAALNRDLVAEETAMLSKL